MPTRDELLDALSELRRATVEGRLAPYKPVVLLWAIGFVFEAGGDAQLARFLSDPANRGRVMDRGLWRYTRHPNYFGDTVVWWSFLVLALAVGAWWGAFGTVLMSVLIVKV